MLRHYVPVLKVKRGEKTALRQLSPNTRERVTPLLEIVEITNNRTVSDHLKTAFNGLSRAVHLFDRCFLDPSEIEPAGHTAVNKVFQRATDAGINYTPVARISKPMIVAAAMAHQTHGIALRLRRDEFEAGHLRSNLINFMVRHRLAEENTDLIVDLGAVEDLVAAGVQTLASAFLAEIPNHARWKTLVLSACAFPRSMGIVGRNSNDLFPRNDWLAWRDGQFAQRNSRFRIPTYSDGTIQHPQGVEGFDPRFMQVSASVRYTVPEYWLLSKGESTRFNPARRQFPYLATQLVYGHLKKHYYGSNHCKGCASMRAAADGVSGFGSAEVWRRLGTIHHITTVVEELDALPSS